MIDAELAFEDEEIDETELPNLFAQAVGSNGDIDFAKVKLLDIESWRKIMVVWLRANQTSVAGVDQQTKICERLYDRTAWFVAQHLKREFETEGEGLAYAGLQLMFFAKLTHGIDDSQRNLQLATMKFKRR